ncbi:hypothetical protein A2291_00335 [candidate division WOR-1 bacterium RIFOXYB2_FULL_42_35]|uniref:DUF6036 domain-containing protein n=1 Tax=candidate division WOR-1 bacterium RIFOXYC2_FULL_41_25 TaxID=1802586 RepID=A0A1F4TME7_UNCSA|nr:MAG: hypothetical protein A2247_01470 [candidate division WOR-1 bacterium RIFOXYA2_FULL_41_14]OGC24249.1 MAG: hypothetical protein A2291_00335 [candidate division WOR-1 bacterium RIFOXYB2_FULL_42_35]OGC33892.1 MAG: hypothetical protein A2462_01305 [candidate division WOR-1 bacterium RIFOXYC2_FULL_41_25]OGC43896.1 MAG: hypothetical protein A2548_02815 [candidate division WOR-1 bacterium RIFOXYD2_FULL_41_8]
MVSAKIIDLEIVTANFIKLLKKTRVPYMIVGGGAVNYFGDFRLTKDLDVVIALEPSSVNGLLGLLDKNGYKFHKKELEMLAKLSNRFALADPSDTYRIDLWIPKTSYEKNALDRRQNKRTNHGLISFISPEDLILFKLLAGRPQDIIDLQGVLTRQKGKLDRKYLKFWAMALDKYEQLKKIEKEL